MFSFLKELCVDTVLVRSDLWNFLYKAWTRKKLGQATFCPAPFIIELGRCYIIMQNSALYYIAKRARRVAKSRHFIVAPIFCSRSTFVIKLNSLLTCEPSS